MYKGYKELNKVYKNKFWEWEIYPDTETTNHYIWTLGLHGKKINLVYDKINGGVTIEY